MKKLIIVMLLGLLVSSCNKKEQKKVELSNQFNKEKYGTDLVIIRKTNKELYSGSPHGLSQIITKDTSLFSEFEGKTYRQVLVSLNEIYKENNKPVLHKRHEQIKKDYVLIGKWKITNSISNFSYKYEVYQKDNEYVGVHLTKKSKETKFEELIKKDEYKYIVKNNRFGEFYAINGTTMLLYDMDGELSSAGYTAKNIK